MNDTAPVAPAAGTCGRAAPGAAPHAGLPVRKPRPRHWALAALAASVLHAIALVLILWPSQQPSRPGPRTQVGLLAPPAMGPVQPTASRRSQPVETRPAPASPGPGQSPPQAELRQPATQAARPSQHQVLTREPPAAAPSPIPPEASAARQPPPPESVAEPLLQARAVEPERPPQAGPIRRVTPLAPQPAEPDAARPRSPQPTRSRAAAPPTAARASEPAPALAGSAPALAARPAEPEPAPETAPPRAEPEPAQAARPAHPDPAPAARSAEPELAPETAPPRAEPEPAQAARPARPDPAPAAGPPPAAQAAGAPGSTLTARSETAAAGSQEPSTEYMARLQAWLGRHQQYPGKAQAQGLEGTALLYFKMDREGRVLEYRLRRSTGHAALDQEVLAMIQRAAPLPAMPEDLALQRLELVVPVAFQLR